MRRARRILAGLVVTFVLLSSVLVTVGIHTYVRPQLDPLRHADAILVLGGDSYDRYPFAIDLALAGWAPNLVISNPVGARHPWLYKFCNDPRSEVSVTCFAPEPHSTRGEARYFGHLAAEHGWRTAIVVAFRPQISRARFIVQRCFDGQLIMVASPTPITGRRWAYEFVYQTAGYARAVLQTGC